MKNILSSINQKNKKKYKDLVQGKLDIIDYAFQRISPRPQSFADLGGVWGVNGAYTFYTLEKHTVKSAFLVDTDFTDQVIKDSDRNENLTLIKSNFGDKSVLEQLGRIDVIFLFDVLLHQVKPDWDEILEIYSSICNCFVIYNQQFINSEKTVRLLDLGFEEYFENTPHDKDHPTYKSLFENMDKIHPQHKRIWRDIHNVWQWGIIDADLCEKMEELGFTLKYYKNDGNFRTLKNGKFGNLKNFQNHAFIFQKE